ncbi:MAG TPA: D-alanine--D-alanine ligase [Kofleriaceae bacterium]
MQTRKIGVLLGGLSSERDVSLRSGEAVITALRERGHEVVPLYVDRDIDVALRQEQIDIAFIALHGRYGEDGCVQGLLEVMGIPYTGSDVMASALAMHKAKAKELFRLHNLPTPAYYVLDAEAIAEAGVPMPLSTASAEELIAIHGDFGFPCVVKPVHEGSSVGVTICRSIAQLGPAIERALRFDDEVLVERFVRGKEISVAVLDDRAIGAVEIAPRDGFYD